MKFIALFAYFCLLLLGIHAQVCTVSSINCEFYNCLEAKYKCGSKGYPIGYGYKYCTKFGKNVYKTSEAKKWTNGVRSCLQSQLSSFANSASTCSVIDQTAFNSHPYCYTSNGICHLVRKCLDPFNWQGYCTDVATIVRTVDAPDLLTKKSAKQVKDTLIECTRRGVKFTSNLQNRFAKYVESHFDDDDENSTSSLESLARLFDRIEAFKAQE